MDGKNFPRWTNMVATTPTLKETIDEKCVSIYCSCGAIQRCGGWILSCDPQSGEWSFLGEVTLWPWLIIHFLVWIFILSLKKIILTAELTYDGEGLIEAVHVERFGWWFRPFYVTNKMGNVRLMPTVYSSLCFDLTLRWYQEETSKK